MSEKKIRYIIFIFGMSVGGIIEKAIERKELYEFGIAFGLAMMLIVIIMILQEYSQDRSDM